MSPPGTGSYGPPDSPAARDDDRPRPAAAGPPPGRRPRPSAADRPGAACPSRGRTVRCRVVGGLCDARQRGDQVSQPRVRRPRRRAAVLNEALARAAARGEPQALLIGGEAGVGKSRLVEEFTGAARAAGAVIAIGGCVEVGADGLPFAPFSAALRALRRAAARRAGRRGRRPGGGAGPAAARARRDRPAPAREDGTARLFELTVRMLERIAAERTVVLVLEDLHWADASTRHLLAYLFRTLRRGRLVVVATYRADDIHRRHPLRPLLAELDRLRSVAPHRTGPLHPRRGPPPARRDPRRRARTAPGGRDIRALRRQRLLRRGTRRVPRPRRLLPRPQRLPARPAARPRRGPARERPAGRADRRRGRLHRGVPAARRRRPARRGQAHRGAAGRRRREHPAARVGRRRLPLPPLPGPRGRQRRPAARRVLAPQPPLRRSAGGRPLARPGRRAHHPAGHLLVPRARRGQGAARRAARLRRGPPPARLRRATAAAHGRWNCGTRSPRRCATGCGPSTTAGSYPACGRDPRDRAALRYLDLLAESVEAARLCGDRERALKLAKKALRLIEAERPVRGRPAARRLVLDPALPADPEPGARRRLGRDRHRPGAGARASALGRARRGAGRRRQLGHAAHAGTRIARRGRTGRRLRQAGGQRGDRAQRRAHAR